MSLNYRILIRKIVKSIIRIGLAASSICGVVIILYLLWTPGMIIKDGRHDLGENAIWLQHGWLGNDKWFKDNHRNPDLFRDRKKILQLINKLFRYHIKYLYPHLCPCSSDGKIAEVNHAQVELFLDCANGMMILPWVGGTKERQAFPESPTWRNNFKSSIIDLISAHPRLAGIHINIEPMPSGNHDFLLLLQELKQALPKDKILSVAAYPPPTFLHQFPNVHWDKQYYGKVSKYADQLAVMMYDTAVTRKKIYQHLISEWTKEVLAWSDSRIFLGMPVYDDIGVKYHDPDVENIKNFLLGIHAGLGNINIPSNYAGIAIYCEWEMDNNEWAYLSENFISNTILPVSILRGHASKRSD